MAELETRVSDLERNVDRVMTKLDMFIAESREARQRQDAEIRELRQRQDAKIESMGQHVRNISIAAIVGIATLVVVVFLK